MNKKPNNIKSIEIGEGLEYHEPYSAEHECELIMQDGKTLTGTVLVDSGEIIWDTLEIEEE